MIKILIVDDDHIIIDEIQENLPWKELGIEEVFCAYNVDHAIEIIKEEQIDIIISDIEMPQASGLDLLKWVRANDYESYFLMLTCHENFDFAQEAINYGACAYLTKPLDIHTLELNLQRIVTSIQNKKNTETDYSFAKVDFWKTLLLGEFFDYRYIKKEASLRSIELKKNQKYRLIYCRITSSENDVEKYGRDVFEYILEGMQSELLTKKIANENVVKIYVADTLNFITVSEEEDPYELAKLCNELIDNCKKYFESLVTCCISNICSISDMTEVNHKLRSLLESNIGLYGSVFFEKDVYISQIDERQIIDFEKFEQMIVNVDTEGILRYLKLTFKHLNDSSLLNVHSLYIIKEEVLQVIYAHLMKKGIQATKLFIDQRSIRLSDHATDSPVDMIKWCKNILEKTFDYEETVNKTPSLIEQINAFIHGHYSESITRTEVAEHFFLTPEYLAKLYKKKTGVSIKSYINQCRIDKAKVKLRNESTPISDIAESVGYDNFSYFSTLFKKATGLSPKDYRSQQ